MRDALSPSGQHIGPDVLGPAEGDLGFQFVAGSRYATGAFDRLHSLGGGVVMVHGRHVDHILGVDKTVTGVHQHWLRIGLQA